MAPAFPSPIASDCRTGASPSSSSLSSSLSLSALALRPYSRSLPLAAAAAVMCSSLTFAVASASASAFAVVPPMASAVRVEAFAHRGSCRRRFVRSSSFVSLLTSVSDSLAIPKYGLGKRSPAAFSRWTALITTTTTLRSSFYDDFENFDDNDGKREKKKKKKGKDGDDDDDDGDDNDDEKDGIGDQLDEKAFAKFRSEMGNFFDDDEDDDDDSDDDGDEYADLPMKGAGEISSVDDLISFASSRRESGTESTEWAEPVLFDSGNNGGGGDDNLSGLKGGVVLLANPSKFCSDFTFVDDDDDKGNGNKNKNGDPKTSKKRGFGFNPFGSQPSPALLAKFGLTLPPPAELGPDRRADLLPVLVLLERDPMRGCQALLMNRRTGYLLGDLEQQREADGGSAEDDPTPAPKLGAFMIQPLWFGGTSAGGGVGVGDTSDSSKSRNGGGEGGGRRRGGGGANSGGDKNDGDGGGAASGLDMLHMCPAVPGARKLTEDGLYWGGDPTLAQDAMRDPSLDRMMTGFDFKFFVQSTRWLPQQLEKEIRDGTWYVASVSKEILFKSRDRLGTKRAKPLWTEIMELMGGKYKRVRDRLYDDDL